MIIPRENMFLVFLSHLFMLLSFLYLYVTKSTIGIVGLILESQMVVI